MPPADRLSFFVSVGEISGEMHAALLVEAIQEQLAAGGQAPASFEGNGSDRMRAAGVRIHEDTATWGELGIVNIALRAPFYLRMLKRTLRRILDLQPDAVIMVDNRVYHSRLARMLREGGYRGRLIYHVAPVRWESLYREGELERSLTNPRFTMVKRYFDLAILIYPVSLPTYAALGINHRFVGHPLCGRIVPSMSDGVFAQLAGITGRSRDDIALIGAMVGSRMNEVQWIAPAVMRALALLEQRFDGREGRRQLHSVIPVAHPVLRSAVEGHMRRAGLRRATLVDATCTYDIMSRADVMIVKSGTGTHECVLAGTPAVMCFRVPAYLAWFLRRVYRFSMPAYAMPNLLAGHHVLPELIQEDCNPGEIARATTELLENLANRSRMLTEYGKMQLALCPPHKDGCTPLQMAARAVVETIRGTG